MPPIVARRASRGVQRAPTDASGTEQVPGHAMERTASAPEASAPDAPVRIDRSSSGASAASDLRANAFTSGDTIVLPASHGPLDSGRGRSLLAHELVHVGQQRRLGAALPHEASAAGQQLEQEARSAERLVETPAAARLPAHAMAGSSASGLPLARAGARSASPTSPSSDGGSNGDVQRAVDGALTLAGRSSRSAGGNQTASLAPDTALMATSLDDHLVGTQRASADPAPTTSQASSGTGSALGQDDQDLDELARKLYDRIRFRLGRELLLDRERSGLLTGSR
jgi:hypothetical protein